MGLADVVTAVEEYRCWLLLQQCRCQHDTATLGFVVDRDRTTTSRKAADVERMVVVVVAAAAAEETAQRACSDMRLHLDSGTAADILALRHLVLPAH